MDANLLANMELGVHGDAAPGRHTSDMVRPPPSPLFTNDKLHVQFFFGPACFESCHQRQVMMAVLPSLECRSLLSSPTVPLPSYPSFLPHHRPESLFSTSHALDCYSTPTCHA